MTTTLAQPGRTAVELAKTLGIRPGEAAQLLAAAREQLEQANVEYTLDDVVALAINSYE